jgi:ankyrin repeat protein
MEQGKRRALLLTLFCLIFLFSSPRVVRSQGAPGPGQANPEVAKPLSRIEQIKMEQRNGALIFAASRGYTGEVGRLIDEEGADVNARDGEAMTPVMLASLMGHKQTVELLIEKGGNVNFRDIHGATALMEAAWGGHPEIVNLLLERGADPNLKSSNEVPRLKRKGITALMASCVNGNVQIARLLLESGAEVDERDDDGLTALSYASKYGGVEIVKMLLARGADLEIKDQYGRPPLMIAAIHNHTMVLRLLIGAGANLKAKDKNNMTAQFYAQSLGYDDALALLRSARREMVGYY